uniref:serine O-acetyltransferase n=1 Tax=Oryza brachyantha TaxID=4533 RepID=J3LKZ8_ORYBR
MAACVDKWQPAAYPCRLREKFYCLLPDCTTDRPVAVATAASGSTGDRVWDVLRAEAQADADDEPLLRKFYQDLVLSRPSLEAALASMLAAKLCIPGALPQDQLRDLLAGAAPALLLQSRASEVFGVDVHPGARIGCGILLDHATGVVIGETAVVGDDVSILHGVTLGGTGKESGDRHPKVGDGVLIGAGASVLGNVHIGDRAKIGAGAVVLRDVTDGTTAVGNPAKPIIKKAAPQRRPEELPGVTMEQRWSD